ncbi:unnamed protein product [Gordionus sp. m RMFG-2023]
MSCAYNPDKYLLEHPFSKFEDTGKELTNYESPKKREGDLEENFEEESKFPGYEKKLDKEKYSSPDEDYGGKAIEDINKRYEDILNKEDRKDSPAISIGRKDNNNNEKEEKFGKNKNMREKVRAKSEEISSDQNNNVINEEVPRSVNDGITKLPQIIKPQSYFPNRYFRPIIIEKREFQKTSYTPLSSSPRDSYYKSYNAYYREKVDGCDELPSENSIKCDSTFVKKSNAIRKGDGKICGSDHVIYLNACELRKACLRNRSLRPVLFSNCRDSVENNLIVTNSGTTADDEYEYDEEIDKSDIVEGKNGGKYIDNKVGKSKQVSQRISWKTQKNFTKLFLPHEEDQNDVSYNQVKAMLFKDKNEIENVRITNNMAANYDILPTRNQAQKKEEQIKRSPENIPRNSFPKDKKSKSFKDVGYNAFKQWLVDYYRREFIDGNDPFARDDTYLINLIFGFWDTNGDNFLTPKELTSKSREKDLSKALKNYRWTRIQNYLETLIKEGDRNKDSMMDLSEFYQTFNVDSLNSRILEEVKFAQVGSNLKLKCGAKFVLPASIIWKRYDVELNEREFEDIKIFPDGSLYLMNAQMEMAGNYSYQLAETNQIYQTYVVHIIALPSVRIKPARGQMIKAGRVKSVRIMCQSDSYPGYESVKWYKNEKLIRRNVSVVEVNDFNFPNIGVSLSKEVIPENNELGHNDRSVYKFYGNGTILSIENVNYMDTGAYTCQFTNRAGTSKAHSDLFVVEDPTMNFDYEEQRHVDKHDLYIFDESGLKIYDPQECKLRDRIRHNSKISILNYSLDKDLYANHINHDSKNDNGSPALERNDLSRYYLCKMSTKCLWGPAVNVRNKFMYVLQKDVNRIIIFDIIGKKFIEELMVDINPLQLKYVSNVDQVWVISEPHRGNISRPRLKGLQVIREASKSGTHNIIHTEPIEEHFDEVTDVFLPDSMEDKIIQARFGYTTHSDKMRLYKLDLRYFKYVSIIDLSPHQCLPQNVAFYIYGGFIIVRCFNTMGYDKGYLLIDILSDAVIKYQADVHGIPLVSPDQSYLASVDEKTRIIKFHQLDQINGLKYLFDIVAPINPDVRIFHASYNLGTFDLLFASNQQNGIVVFNVINRSSFDIINDYSLTLETSMNKKEKRNAIDNYRNSPYNKGGSGNKIHSARPRTNISLSSSGVFGNYVALKNSNPYNKIILLDVVNKRVHCQIDDIIGQEEYTAIQWSLS